MAVEPEKGKSLMTAFLRKLQPHGKDAMTGGREVKLFDSNSHMDIWTRCLCDFHMSLRLAQHRRLQKHPIKWSSNEQVLKQSQIPKLGLRLLWLSLLRLGLS